MSQKIKTTLKNILPDNAVSKAREAQRRTQEALTGNPIAPIGSDIIGYEHIIRFIDSADILKAEGDLVEIGTFLGGGAYKLSKHIARVSPDKKLFVIDIFSPDTDQTENTNGDQMAALYATTLAKYKGLSQRQIFDDVVKGCRNITVLAEDSKTVTIPTDKLAFAFLDGNHSPEYVVSDFELVWPLISSGGAVGFHDYNHDLPQTTAAIDQMAKKYHSQIAKTQEDADRHIVYFIRK